MGGHDLIPPMRGYHWTSKAGDRMMPAQYEQLREQLYCTLRCFFFSPQAPALKVEKLGQEANILRYSPALGPD